MEGNSVVYLILLAWNVLVFLIYGLDKFLAQNHMWRISEKFLLTSAFLMGGVGALLGMYTFRHKTKHNNFVLLVPVAAILTVILAFFVK